MLALIDNIQRSARNAADKLTDYSQQMDTDDKQQGTALYHLEQTQWKEIGLQGQERRFAAPHTWLSQFIWDIQRNAAERLEMARQRVSLMEDLFASFAPKLEVKPTASSLVVASLKMRSALPALADLGISFIPYIYRSPY